jgi:hypothetical protein
MQEMNIHNMTPEEFRQKTAGLTDPLKQMDEFDRSALKDEAIRFISILPEVFSDDLDRKTLWERIGNGLLIARAKAGNDIESFINNCLDFVKAEPGKVAANENIALFISSISTRPQDWREQFLKTIERSHYLLIVKARARWNENRGGKS